MSSVPKLFQKSSTHHIFITPTLRRWQSDDSRPSYGLARNVLNTGKCFLAGARHLCLLVQRVTLISYCCPMIHWSIARKQNFTRAIS